MQNPKGVEALIPRLEDPDPGVRRDAARALARIGTGRAVKALIDVARQLPELTELVAGCLGDTRSDAGVQALVGMVHPKSCYPHPVRIEAVRSLGRTRSVHSLEALDQILSRSSFPFFGRSKRRALRVAAAHAIGRIGGEEASLVLGAHARSGDFTVRKACREALERMARSETP